MTFADERAERDAQNAKVIADFRANGGRGDMPLLLLHHTGAKSGTERVNPVAYQAVGQNFAIFGSRAGGPHHPDWYHNLRANPRTTIEVGTETLTVTARVAAGEERTTIWEAQKVAAPIFAEYEQRTTREIPVIILERA